MVCAFMANFCCKITLLKLFVVNFCGDLNKADRYEDAQGYPCY